MANFFRKLLGLVRNDDVDKCKVEVEKAKLVNQKMESIAELVTLNKKFKLVIERGEIEVVIKEITDITKGQ